VVTALLNNNNNHLKHLAKKYIGHFFTRLVLPLIIVLFTGCSSAPKITPSPTVQPTLPPVINYALSLQGMPYRYGKVSPGEGFDCSGFIMHVYKRHGVYMPRTVREMARSLPRIEKNDLQSGDLVFFNTNGNKFSHVGLLVKDDKFVHAPSRRTGRVLVSSLNNSYWRKHFTGARRPRVVEYVSHRRKISKQKPGVINY
jgi:NlpC/P60 family